MYYRLSEDLNVCLQTCQTDSVELFMSAISGTWSQIKQLLANMRWIYKLAWSTAPALFLGIVAVNAIRSLIPAALALASRNLINGVSATINEPTQDSTDVTLWLVISALIALIGALANVGYSFFNQRLQDELNLRINTDVLVHAAKLDIAFFEDSDSRDMMQRARDNMALHCSQFLAISLNIITNAIQIISLLAILVMIEPLVVFLMVPISLLYLLFHWRFARKRFVEEHIRARRNRWTQYYVGQLTNDVSVGQVRLLGLAPLFIRQFRGILTEFRDRNRKLHIYGLIGGALFAVASVVTVYFAFAQATLSAISGGLTIGDVAIFGGAVVRLRSATDSLIGWVGSLRWQALFVTNLAEFLATEPEMDRSGIVIPERSHGSVAVEDVAFAYPGSKAPVLENVSFQIEPGETVAVVGENGAGKTTLVKLLTRLYDPDEGRILLDQVDLRDLAPEYLQKQISFVFQLFERYSATAAENIAYGDWPRLLHDREEIERIARQTAVDQMIEEMPQGYDTMLGRMFGVHNLSGGQWQRLAIARALARNSSLLILDEPTANLDARAEFQIFSEFKKLAEERTTILISHRFSTVSIADRIIVMHKGRIIESGTHDQLLADDGHYSALYNLQRQRLNIET